MIEEIRIDNLGVIGRAHVELRTRADGPDRRDRRRQDDGAHRAQPAARRQGGPGDGARRVDVGGGRGARRARPRAARRSSGPRRPAPSWTTTAASCSCARSAPAGRRGRPVARVRGWAVGPAGGARRARRRAGHRARPGRPGAAAVAGRAARGARRVRRRRAPRGARALPRRPGPSARGSTRSSPTSSTRRGTGRARPSCCGSGLAEVERVDPQPGEDVDARRGGRPALARRGPADGGGRGARGARRRGRGRRGRRGGRHDRAARAGCSSTRAPTTPRSPRCATRIAEAGLPARRRRDRPGRVPARTCRRTRCASTPPSAAAPSWAP